MTIWTAFVWGCCVGLLAGISLTLWVGLAILDRREK
jgi:hypothetical protein